MGWTNPPTTVSLGGPVMVTGISDPVVVTGIVEVTPAGTQPANAPGPSSSLWVDDDTRVGGLTIPGAGGLIVAGTGTYRGAIGVETGGTDPVTVLIYDLTSAPANDNALLDVLHLAAGAGGSQRSPAGQPITTGLWAVLLGAGTLDHARALYAVPR